MGYLCWEGKRGGEKCNLNMTPNLRKTVIYNNKVNLTTSSTSRSKEKEKQEMSTNLINLYETLKLKGRELYQ